MDIQFFDKFPHYPTFLVIRLPFCPVKVDTVLMSSSGIAHTYKQILFLFLY
jgi:hypothetical protein